LDDSHKGEESLNGDLDLADMLMSYLAECPDAMDTLEGIAGWWVTRQRVRNEANAVSKVLQRLINAGLVDKIGSGEQAWYRLRKQENKH
jgi:hypothetical protein